MYIGSDHVQSLVKTRRLLLLASQAGKAHPEAAADGPSFKEIMENNEIRPVDSNTEPKQAAPSKPQTGLPLDGSCIDKST